MRLFNQDNMNLSVHSEVKWGIRKLEVELALDNTGSMAQAGKLRNLKTAAHNLLTTLSNASKNPGDIKVAIIPFTTTVNLGTSYKVGNTNVGIGLVWAWHALTAQAPLSEAAASAPDLDKVIILLTDGDNTESWKNSNHTMVKSSSAIDDRTRLVCTNVKAGGIKLYTIRVIDGNASLLQSCATNPTMYYDVQQASQFNSVFTAIAQNLSNLRIAK